MKAIEKTKDYVKRKWQDYAVAFLVFCCLPFIFFSYVPGDWIFNPINYTAENVNLSQSTTQTIIANRSIGVDFTGDWLDGLFLQCENGCAQTKIVQLSGSANYVQSKGNTVIFRQDLSNLELVEGQYKWYFSVKAHLPYGVTRTFLFESNVFNVTK